MADQTNTSADEPRGTFGFERKVNLELRGGPVFENAVASCYVQFPVDWNDEAKTAEAIQGAAFLARTAVYEQLGLKVEYDSDAGVLREVFEKTFGNVQNVTNQGPAPSAPASAAPQPAAQRQTNADSPACPTCGGGMYDNRQRNNEKAAAGQKLGPDWRCKRYKPENGNCGGVIWRPRG